MKKLLVLFLLMNTSNSAFSKADFFSTWLDYNYSNKLNNNWFIDGDYGYRFRLGYDYNWQRVHARVGLGYKFDKLKVLGGVALFSAFEPSDYLDLEVRPWQAIKYLWKINEKIRIANFVRLEERFHFFGDGSGGSYNYFVMIFRYSLTVKYSFNNPKDKIGKWEGFIGFEPFFKVFENNTSIVKSRSRSTAGVSYYFSKKMRLRASYIFQPQNIPMFQETTSYANVFRLSLFHYL